MFPPKSDQKPGDIPLGECINDTTMPTPFGPGCWQAFFLPRTSPPTTRWSPRPDSLDSRMQQTWYVNGTLWGSSGTAVRVNGELKAGIAWFAVSPKINGAGKIEGKVKKQGYIALANNNLTMPAIAFTPSGKGAIAFTVLGETYYPSAGYVRIDESGVGRTDPRRRRGPRATTTGSPLQGVRRRSAADPLGRLRRRRDRRRPRSGSPRSTSARPARWRSTSRADPRQLRKLRRHPHEARELVHQLTKLSP